MSDDKIQPQDFTKAEFMDELDRITMENYFLRLQNAQLQIQALEGQKADLITQIRGMQTKFEDFKKSLEKKYGMPIGPACIDKTGKLQRPTPPAPPIDLPDSIAADN
jgi:hypothetical protein